MPFGISARQFRNLWLLGETVEVEEGGEMVEAGSPHWHVELVLKGHVSRYSGGNHVPGLDSYPGRRRQDADGYDAGAWVGEVNALQLIDTVSAPEAASRELYRRRLAQALNSEDNEDNYADNFREYRDDFGLHLSQEADAGLDGLLQTSVARWTVRAG